MPEQNPEVANKGRIVHVREFGRGTSGILDSFVPLRGPQPEDTGAHRQKISDSIPIPFQLLFNHRAGTDQRHLSPEYVDELWELINVADA